MQRQASRRNRAAIAAGRVELRVGTADRLPYPDGHFSKACAIHTVYFWPSVEAGLREIRRVLAPDGRLVVGVRMRRAEAGVLDPSRYGLTDDQLAALVATLEQVGFRDVAAQPQVVARQTLATVTARR
jgi:ubiquinone/menaquinone biosynthesis C-methylase UbiE